MNKKYSFINTSQEFILWFIRKFEDRDGFIACRIPGRNYFTKADTEDERVRNIAFCFKTGMISAKARSRNEKQELEPDPKYIRIFDDAVQIYNEAQPYLSSFLQRNINEKRKKEYMERQKTARSGFHGWIGIISESRTLDAHND